MLRGLSLVLAVFLVLTGRLFVWPTRDSPAPADAIVMFAGSPGRLDRAVELARAGYAPVLAVSVPTGEGPCPPPIPGVEVLCFSPDPRTTRGEARWTARVAAERGWRSLLVVTSTPQDTRARLRLRRCYRGEVRLVPVNPPRRSWPYMIMYEWAAMAKAVLWQRGC
jgi:hypothetical protein